MLKLSVSSDNVHSTRNGSQTKLYSTFQDWIWVLFRFVRNSILLLHYFKKNDQLFQSCSSTRNPFFRFWKIKSFSFSFYKQKCKKTGLHILDVSASSQFRVPKAIGVVGKQTITFRFKSDKYYYSIVKLTKEKKARSSTDFPPKIDSIEISHFYDAVKQILKEKKKKKLK